MGGLAVVPLAFGQLSHVTYFCSLPVRLTIAHFQPFPLNLDIVLLLYLPKRMLCSLRFIKTINLRIYAPTCEPDYLPQRWLDHQESALAKVDSFIFSWVLRLFRKLCCISRRIGKWGLGPEPLVGWLSFTISLIKKLLQLACTFMQSITKLEKG